MHQSSSVFCGTPLVSTLYFWLCLDLAAEVTCSLPQTGPSDDVVAVPLALNGLCGAACPLGPGRVAWPLTRSRG